MTPGKQRSDAASEPKAGGHGLRANRLEPLHDDGLLLGHHLAHAFAQTGALQHFGGPRELFRHPRPSVLPPLRRLRRQLDQLRDRQLPEEGREDAQRDERRQEHGRHRHRDRHTPGGAEPLVVGAADQRRDRAHRQRQEDPGEGAQEQRRQPAEQADRNQDHQGRDGGDRRGDGAGLPVGEIKCHHGRPVQ